MVFGSRRDLLPIVNRQINYRLYSHLVQYIVIDVTYSLLLTDRSVTDYIANCYYI